MKYAFLGLGFIMTGAVGVVLIVMFENVTVNNESEYYVLKESVEAAMYESIDIKYLRCAGEYKIIEEKFVSNCTRRFYNNISGMGNKYKLEFGDIMEKPPKVSVIATSFTDNYSISADDSDLNFNIKNSFSAIFETPYESGGWGCGDYDY